MIQGQQVMWNENGALGRVKWVTNRGSFAVNWDNGEYTEYTSCCQKLVTVII